MRRVLSISPLGKHLEHRGAKALLCPFGPKGHGEVAFLAAFSSTITTADIANFRNIVGKTTTYGDGEFGAYHDLGQVMRAMSANTNGALKAASDAVIKALDAAVFARTPDWRGSFGLSIYIPLLASEKDAAFADHSGYALATGWASLLGKLGI